MTKHIFTFGQGHTLANCYVVIKADDANSARNKMFSVYGTLWAFQYASTADAGVDRFNLKEVPLGTPNERTY